MSQACSFSLFSSVGGKGMVSGFGGGSWHLGQLHGAVRPVCHSMVVYLLMLWHRAVGYG